MLLSASRSGKMADCAQVQQTVLDLKFRTPTQHVFKLCFVNIVFFLFCRAWLFCFSCVREREKMKDDNLATCFYHYVIRRAVFHLVVHVLRFLYEHNDKPHESMHTRKENNQSQ